MQINAIDCTLCGVIIESVLMRTEGIKSASVNDQTKRANVVFDPELIDAKAIQNKIFSLGYKTDNLGESQA